MGLGHPEDGGEPQQGRRRVLDQPGRLHDVLLTDHHLQPHAGRRLRRAR